MKKKLLIINRVQYGYHTDTMKYCQYLKEQFDITYICFDTHQRKMDEAGIKIVYVSHEGNFLKKGLRFIQTSRKYMKNHQFNLVFVVYFKMSFFLGFMFRKKNVILDIRTGAVWYNKKKRKIDNIIIKFESLFFKNVTIISECLRQRLRIKNEKVHILPLGSDSFSSTNKSYDNLDLLYIGGFNNRNISETIYGLKLFLDKNKSIENIKYDIVGYGHDFEEEKIIKAINDTHLNDVITLHGKIPYDQINPFFMKNNIGICHVPVTDYFNCQPSTKLFEYINSGLVCLATDTDENKAYINEINGVLYKDDPSSFSEALLELYHKRKQYKTPEVKDTLKIYSWELIVKDNLLPYLNKVRN